MEEEVAVAEADKQVLLELPDKVILEATVKLQVKIMVLVAVAAQGPAEPPELQLQAAQAVLV